MIEEGLDCARLNCSHASREELRRRSREVRDAARRVNRPIALLFDLQGPKIRLGQLTKQHLGKGEEIILCDTASDKEGTIEINVPRLSDLVTEQSEIVIGDGAPRLEVLELNEHEVRVRTISPGSISSRKGVTVTFAELSKETLTPKDYQDLDTAVECKADFIALSFVRNANDVSVLRKELEKRNSSARLIAKIEKIEAYQNLDEIIEAADGILVARGDYGVEAGVTEVPLMQKDTIRRAGIAGKLVITATQMLESMIDAPSPTRAEATDVANAVIDGTSAVMLSAETGVGSFPVESVAVMSALAIAAERDESVYRTAPRERASSAAEAIMRAAVILAYEARAKAIIVPTTSGGSVRACARYRPKSSVIALCHKPKIANQLALEWGVYPGLMELTEGVEQTIAIALKKSKEIGDLPQGAKVVVSAGPSPGNSGETHLVTLRDVP